MEYGTQIKNKIQALQYYTVYRVSCGYYFSVVVVM